MKRKILFIVPLPPPVHGSSMMCDYIRKSKLINEEFDCDFVNLSTSRSIDEIGKGGIQKCLRLISSFTKTFWKLLTNRYDACYIALTCHGNGFLKDAPFALLCKMFGRKLIIHQHNKGMSRDLGSHWRTRLLKVVYRNSTVILLSWRLYPDIESVVNRYQVRICPNGIPEDPYFDNLPERRNTVPQLLFLSNLIPSKGVFVLLDALKILKERGYKFICNFVGGESKHVSAEVFNNAVTERGLNGIAIYLGKKYSHKKHEILKQNDVFVFPTFYDNECFPLVLLEAMQAGLPCVSTDEGAIPDIVSQNTTGFIVPKNDSVALADKLAILIKDPKLRKKMGDAGFSKFIENFTLNLFESKIINCLS